MPISTINESKLRKGLIAILDNEDGVKSEGVALIQEALPQFKDIWDLLEANDGFTYLPEDHTLS